MMSFQQAHKIYFSNQKKNAHTIKLTMRIMPDRKRAYIRYFGKISI